MLKPCVQVSSRELGLFAQDDIDKIQFEFTLRGSMLEELPFHPTPPPPPLKITNMLLEAT